MEANLGHLKSCPCQNSFKVASPKIAPMSLTGEKLVQKARQRQRSLGYSRSALYWNCEIMAIQPSKLLIFWNLGLKQRWWILYFFFKTLFLLPCPSIRGEEELAPCSSSKLFGHRHPLPKSLLLPYKSLVPSNLWNVESWGLFECSEGYVQLPPALLIFAHLLLGSHCLQQLWLFLGGQALRVLQCSIFSKAKVPVGFPHGFWAASHQASAPSVFVCGLLVWPYCHVVWAQKAAHG